MILTGTACALEEVYLDLDSPDFHKFNTGKIEYENKKLETDDDEDYLKPSIWTLKKMFDEDFRSEENKSYKPQN